MKRSAVLLLAAAFCLCGCINEIPDYIDPIELGITESPIILTDANNTPASGNKDASSASPTPVPSPVVTESVVLQEENVIIRVKSLQFSDSGQASLLFEIENGTDTDITVYGTDIQVNNSRVSGVFEQSLDAGESTDQASLVISSADLDELEIEVIRSIGFTMSIRSNNSTKELVSSRPIVVTATTPASASPEPTSSGSAAPQASSSPDSQSVLVDEDDMVLSVLSTEKSSRGLYINIQMENHSNKDASFAVGELILNGKSINMQNLVKDCESGQQEKESIWVSADNLDEAGITAIETVQFHARIYNSDGDIFNGTVTYNVNI